ncbi:roadblock/LC7 domain-containing protein [Pseudoxanthomonas suwonensis]|uniref:roadblock/LC7 domain-containing protein n=1 Tax=Pseudoxanthomonas suwonensis TaxID=314722 RepID=UPI0009DE3117|nr:roadblock/LC7 domain-containing protein [Pseudoxanthomonas suwonensis]
MGSNDMSLDAAHRDATRDELDRLVDRHSGFLVAALAMRDGRPFVHRHRREVDTAKLAAMSSAMVALGNTVLTELSAGTLDHVLVEGRLGKLVLVRIPERSGLLILSVLASTETLNGLVLGQARSCAVAIGEILMRPAATASVEVAVPAPAALGGQGDIAALGMPVPAT